MSRWPGVPCGFRLLQPSPLPEHPQELSSGRRCQKGLFQGYELTDRGGRRDRLGHPHPGCHPFPALQP